MTCGIVALWLTLGGLGYRKGRTRLAVTLLGAAAVFWTEPVLRTMYLGQVNLVLMALNLLPIPPLDGGRIAVSLLPNRAAAVWARLEPFGFFVIVALMFTPLLGELIRPLSNAGASLLRMIVGI